jgi:hypothetical protein
MVRASFASNLTRDSGGILLPPRKQIGAILASKLVNNLVSANDATGILRDLASTALYDAPVAISGCRTIKPHSDAAPSGNQDDAAYKRGHTIRRYHMRDPSRDDGRDRDQG